MCVGMIARKPLHGSTESCKSCPAIQTAVFIIILSSLKRFALLFCLLSCLLFPAIGWAESASSDTMTIKVSDYKTLQYNLTRLSEINSNSQNELLNLKNELMQSQERSAKAQAELTVARKKLQEAEKQLTEQKKVLTESEAISKNQEDSLKKVNESLTAISKEEKRTRLRVKAQRNLFEAISASLLIAYAAK